MRRRAGDRERGREPAAIADRRRSSGSPGADARRERVRIPAPSSGTRGSASPVEGRPASSRARQAARRLRPLLAAAVGSPTGSPTRTIPAGSSIASDPAVGRPLDPPDGLERVAGRSRTELERPRPRARSGRRPSRRRGRSRPSRSPRRGRRRGPARRRARRSRRGRCRRASRRYRAPPPAPAIAVPAAVSPRPDPVVAPPADGRRPARRVVGRADRASGPPPTRHDREAAVRGGRVRPADDPDDGRRSALDERRRRDAAHRPGPRIGTRLPPTTQLGRASDRPSRWTSTMSPRDADEPPFVGGAGRGPELEGAGIPRRCRAIAAAGRIRGAPYARPTSPVDADPAIRRRARSRRSGGRTSIAAVPSWMTMRRPVASSSVGRTVVTDALDRRIAALRPGSRRRSTGRARSSLRSTPAAWPSRQARSTAPDPTSRTMSRAIAQPEPVAVERALPAGPLADDAGQAQPIARRDRGRRRGRRRRRPTIRIWPPATSTGRSARSPLVAFAGFALERCRRSSTSRPRPPRRAAARSIGSGRGQGRRRPWAGAHRRRAGARAGRTDRRACP